MPTWIVNTHEAKSRLSELIRAAEEGTEVIVARNGRPVAKLVAWDALERHRRPGAWAGLIDLPDDLVGSDPDVLAAFDDSAAASD